MDLILVNFHSSHLKIYIIPIFSNSETRLLKINEICHQYTVSCIVNWDFNQAFPNPTFLPLYTNFSQVPLYSSYSPYEREGLVLNYA